MNRRLRIAFVHDAYPSYRRKLFALMREQHEITFYFLNQDSGLLPPGSANIRGFRVPFFSDYTVAPSLLAHLLADHRRSPFDLIVSPEPSTFSAHAACAAARRLGLPYIAWSGEWFTARHPRRWLMRPVERKLISEATVCLAYGNRAAARLQAYGARPGDILVTGNSSGYVYQKPDAAILEQARKDWLIGSLPVVLFLGRLLKFKAPDLLLDAFQLLQGRTDAFLLVAGSGPMLATLLEKKERMSLRQCRLTAREVRTDEEKNLLYGLASVFVLPSRRARVAEPWGLVVNEAASAGLPIVVSDHVGAAGDLIRNGINGTVVPEGDPAALADGLYRYLMDTEMARIHGRQARADSESFSVDRMAAVFLGAFERCMEGM